MVFFCLPFGDSALDFPRDRLSQQRGSLPFECKLINAYYYLPRFGGLRETVTGSSEPMSPFRFRETLSSPLQGIARDVGLSD